MPIFPQDIQEVTEFEALLGKARFKRYLTAYEGDKTAALRLYMWNAQISQAFYLPLQIWEIGLRNKLNDFLCWKYGPDWPSDETRAVRQLKSVDQQTLREASQKQLRLRGARVSTDAIVADLSAGFWVRLLGHGYSVPFQWRYNLSRVFPAPSNSQWRISPSGFDMTGPHKLCEAVLDLRNRVAHHEPLAWMNLNDLYFKIGALTYALSPVAYSYLLSSSAVPKVLAERPT